MKNKDWYKLDNIGKFYSSIAYSKIPAVFRFSATLNEEIDGKILQKALDKTIDIFPNFNVNLRRGFFWNYLQYTNKKRYVVEENTPICFRLYHGKDSFLYRVNYYKNRINLEMSHILSDGRGSLEFFKMLLTNYIKISHPNEKILIEYDASDSEKNEDSFDKYYKKERSFFKKKKKIYRIKAKKLINETRFMELHLSAKEVLAIAHEYNTTLTGLIISVLIDSIKKEIKIRDLNKVIRIDVPVDLRNYFPSLTIKNFFGLTYVEYNFKSKEDTLEDIIKSVSEQLKNRITKENLSKRVNKMVSLEKNVILRVTPLGLKDFALNLTDKFATSGCTTCVSNLGKIKTNKILEKYVKDINVLNSTGSFKFTICSYNDNLSIGISTVFRQNDIIKDFCRFFTSQTSTAYLNTNMEENS